MKLSFFMLSKLLKMTTTLVIAGYLFFSLNILFIYLNQILQNSTVLLSLIAFILLGLQHFLYIRVKLDSEILSMMYSDSNEQGLKRLTTQLDHSLISLGLMSKKKSNREWNLRFEGCFRLFKFQIVILCLQSISLFTIVIIHKL